MKMRAAIPHYF